VDPGIIITLALVAIGGKRALEVVADSLAVTGPV
jgi:hypothetical protein